MPPKYEIKNSLGAGQWIDNDRSLERAYMCSHQSVSTEIGKGKISRHFCCSVACSGNGDCPTGWLKLRHYCYKLMTAPLSFEEASESCKQMPAQNNLEGKVSDLASVVDEYEFNLGRIFETLIRLDN